MEWEGFEQWMGCVSSFSGTELCQLFQQQYFGVPGLLSLLLFLVVVGGDCVC